MKIRCNTFWLPKRGNSAQEYEDAAWPEEPVEVETKQFRCAVADGATEASFSDRWAKLLVRGFAEETDLGVLQEEWISAVRAMELPWYAQEKAESGAFATLVGLNLMEEEGELRYAARAVGDSCLLHIRDGKLLFSFPLTDASEFNNSPVLLPSTMKPEEVELLFSKKEDTFQSGDRFLLLTDAIACWTLNGVAQNAISRLLEITEQTQIDSLVFEARDAHDEEGRPLMRNDDVTLLSIEVTH